MEIQKLQENLAFIGNQINEVAHQVDRNPAEIQLVVVTKTVEVETVEKLAQIGIKNIGENRVQSAKEKYSGLKKYPGLTWHMIGHLQSNKVKQALSIFDIFHSVDRLKIAQELSQQATKAIPVLLQVNISKEESKKGFWEEELWQKIPQIAALPNLKIKGLMTMAPFTDDMSICKKYFKKTKILAEQLRDRCYIQEEMIELSMGMSGDFRIAIEEGATIIRVGSAIFS